MKKQRIKKKQIQNLWSLNANEVSVASWLKNELGKDYEVFFPVNFRFPYVDLIVFNSKNKKTTTVQVKSSQSYLVKDEPEDYWVSGHDKIQLEKIDPDRVDFFIFTCYYPKTSEKDHKSRNITKYFVVFQTSKLLDYVWKFKDSKTIKSKRIKFSFYVYPPNDKGKLYEDWGLKEEYSRNDYEKLKPLSNVMDNFDKIKEMLQ